MNINILPVPRVLALGVDPGFAKIGVAVVSILEPKEVLALRLFKTDKNTAVRRSSDDNVQRSIEISRMLYEIYDEFPGIKVVCAESMSFPPNASTAGKISMCWGVLSAFVDQKDLCIVQNGPQEIKKKLCNNKAATKEDVQQAIERLFAPQVLSTLHPKLAASHWEHVYDAASAVMAAWDSSEFKLLRSMSGGHQ